MTFTRDDMRGLSFGLYERKVTQTWARRVVGPFAVETLEGRMECPDGWVALDVHGNPYPIAADVFERTFHQEPVDEGQPEEAS